MNIKRALAITAAAALTVVALSASSCQNLVESPQTQDLDESKFDTVDPDRVVIIRNADGFPNYSVTCFEGSAFVSVSSSGDPAWSLAEDNPNNVNAGNNGRFEAVEGLNDYCSTV